MALSSASVAESSATAAFVAVGRTLAICVCGYFVARHRARAGGANTWRDLARLNAEFITPCLCIGAVTSGITPQVLAELWPVVALGVLLPCVWLVLGALGAKLLFASDQQQFWRLAAVTVAYPNGFALPYPLLLALGRQVPWLRERESADEFSATVTVLFSLVMLLQIWTIAFAIYGRADQDPQPVCAGKSNCCEIEVGAAGMPKTAEAECVEPAAIDVGTIHDLQTNGNSVHAHAECGTDAGAATPDLPKDSSGKLTRSSTTASLIELGGSGARAIREISNPLVASLILSLLLAISPLREPFVNSVVHDTIKMVGTACVPLTLVSVGAGMARPPSVATGTGALSFRSAWIIVFLRLVVANGIGTSIVTAFRHQGWLMDRHVALCMYLMCCSPTAANVGLVSSVQGTYVQPTALVLFLVQLIATPTMTLSIMCYTAMLW